MPGMQVRVLLGVLVGAVRQDGGRVHLTKGFQMRFMSMAIAVAALSLVGASSPGAMTRTDPQVRVTASAAWWHQTVRITYLDGSSEWGYRRWFGWADSPVDPVIYVLSGGWTPQWPSMLIGAKVEVVGEPYAGH